MKHYEENYVIIMTGSHPQVVIFQTSEIDLIWFFKEYQNKKYDSLIKL
jgi:uncharacterized short protein YbdD (DUF466 family)